MAFNGIHPHVRKCKNAIIIFESWKKIYLVDGINRFLISSDNRMYGGKCYRSWEKLWKGLHKNKTMDTTLALSLVRKHGYSASGIGLSRVPDYSQYTIIGEKDGAEEAEK